MNGEPTNHIVAYLTGAVTWPLPCVVWPVPFAVPFWIIYAWSRYGERKVLLRPHSAENDDQGSWAAIDYGSKAARIAAVVTAFATPPWGNSAQRIWIYGVGLLLMVSGAGLRRYCFRTLGDHFTFQVTVPSEHKLLREGIYKWVRHPSYTGGMMFNVGIGLALTNWGSTLLLAVGMAMVYIYRVHVEERALLRVHGRAYSEYMLETKRFIPFVI
jgi:protein-S-isoprenylcysteine O-methyltransferase Ste14